MCVKECNATSCSEFMLITEVLLSSRHDLPCDNEQLWAQSLPMLYPALATGQGFWTVIGSRHSTCRRTDAFLRLRKPLSRPCRRERLRMSAVPVPSSWCKPEVSTGCRPAASEAS